MPLHTSWATSIHSLVACWKAHCPQRLKMHVVSIHYEQDVVVCLVQRCRTGYIRLGPLKYVQQAATVCSQESNTLYHCHYMLVPSIAVSLIHCSTSKNQSILSNCCLQNSSSTTHQALLQLLGHRSRKADSSTSSFIYPQQQSGSSAPNVNKLHLFQSPSRTAHVQIGYQDAFAAL
jgi:hypothetical protein